MGFFTPLLLAVQQPNDHVRHLDQYLVALIPEAIHTYPTSLPSKYPTDINHHTAKSIIARLPDIPQLMFPLPFAFKGLARGKNTLWDKWASKYLLPEACQNLSLVLMDDTVGIMETLHNVQEIAWNNLFVNVYMDTNSVALAIKIQQQGTRENLRFAEDFLGYLSLLADLIDEFEDLLDKENYGDPGLFSDTSDLKLSLFPIAEGDHKESRGVLRIYMWTVWQRSVMLYFYYILKVQLNQGYSTKWNSMLAIKGIERLSDLDYDVYRGDGIPYMCNWAFKVLRTSRSSTGLDFRTMIARFNAHFGERVGRCIKNSETSCTGDQPASCHRFTGAETKSQSFHSSSCNGSCGRIGWSEESYRSFEGPRAVRFGSNDAHLKYCQASSSTMAISHVWSHGQGGRPENGINFCLHELYMQLAKLVGYDSYWIDSACIPSEPKLRMEAINGINPVFTTSRVVLVSDMDLQSVDILGTDIQNLETLMSILLVCDWNVRAWTMLEEIRGRKNVYLLCKDGHVVSMVELFKIIMDEGAIDLAVLLGSAQHLIPSSEPERPVAIEDSGSLLSQRHASRPGDEVVIWGLLNNLSGTKSPLVLWKSQKSVRTGYLMSSTPRLTIYGYNWAPTEPYVRPQPRKTILAYDSNENSQLSQKYTACYPPYDGEGSYNAKITDGGLEGKWFVRDMDSEVLATYRNFYCDKTPLGVGHPSEKILNPDLDEEVDVFEQPDTANACSVIGNFLNEGKRVRVVKPSAICGTKPYEGGSNRGESYGLLGAICVLVEGADVWKWEGVYQWLDEPDKFPFWDIEDMVIV